jgi:OmpA-OmpF porin, OOP family
MKKKIVSCLSAALLLGSIGSAHADVKVDSFSLTPFVGGYVFDGKQHLKNGPAFGLRGGYIMTEHLGTEAVVDLTPTESRDAGSLHRNVYNYHLDLLYHFFPSEQVVPFLMAGLGVVTFDGTPKHVDRFAVNYGLGVKYALTDLVQLRGEVRGIHYRYGDSPNDNLEYGLGLGFVFGGAKAPAKAAMAEEKPLIPAQQIAVVEPQSAPVVEPVVVQQPEPTPPVVAPVVKPIPVVVPAPVRVEPVIPAPKPAPVVIIPARPSCAITAGVDTITVGQSTTLNWDCTGSETTVIRPSLGEVASKGSTSVNPEITTTYQVTGSNQAGLATANATVRVNPPALEKRSISLNVRFDTGKAVIKPAYNAEIGRVAAFMKQFPDVKGTIKGYTDNVGDAKKNVQLSQRRADAVVNNLVKKYGIKKSRLSAIGYGPAEPAADNATPQGREKNRRTIATFDSIVQAKK